MNELMKPDLSRRLADFLDGTCVCLAFLIVAAAADDAGCRLLVTGCWLLLAIAGYCWLLPLRCSVLQAVGHAEATPEAQEILSFSLL